jgi:hypothetical protein
MKNLVESIFLVCLFLVSGCSKPKNPPADALPPATTTGANTFGCLVEGRVWLPNWDAGNPPVKLYLGNDHFFSVTARRTVHNPSYVQTALIWDFENVGDTGMYYPTNAWNFHYEFEDYNALNFIDVVDGHNLNYLHITHLDNKIISGTFKLTLYNPFRPDTVHITDGRFDLIYN